MTTVATLPARVGAEVRTGLIVWDTLTEPDETSRGLRVESFTDAADPGYGGYVVSTHTLPSGEVVIQWGHGHGLASVTLHAPDEPATVDPD